MIQIRNCLLLLLLLFLQFLSQTARAQDGSAWNLPKLTGDIVIDGHVDEEAWSDIAPLPMTMYQPVHRGEMSEKSLVRAAYDNEFVYLSGVLHDSDPDKIVANSLYRNSYSGDETFAIILDSFNDNENAKWFFVTPTGNRIDMLISKDSEGENTINRNWTTYWDAAARITDQGWEVEIRVPFSSLGFTKESNSDEVIMGLIAYRWMARQAERHIFPDIAPEWSRGFTKPSQAQKVRMTGIDYEKPIYITPYLLGGAEQLYSLNDNGDRYSRTTDYTTEAGLDIRYPVTANLNLDVTLNTDFAQVEADEAQVNLSRQPLFFPEKRQFFQERSDIFDFNLGGNNTLFYSRRIGLAQGQPVRIYGGARLAGRSGKWEVGMLNMQTEKIADINLPSENFGVLRTRRDIGTESHAGGILTTRLGANGEYNIGTGFDLLLNYTGDHFVDLKYAATFDSGAEGAFSPFSNGLIRFNLHRQTSSGFFYRFTAKRSGEGYKPAMGFESRFNYTLYDARINYGFFHGTTSPLRVTTPQLRYFVTFRNEDRSVESMLVENSWDFNFKNNTELRFTANWWYEDLRQPLFFSDDTFVDPGSYSFFGAEANYRMNSATALRSDLAAKLLTFYDGYQYSVSLSPTWNQSRHLELSGGFEINYLNFPDRNQSEYLNVFRLRALAALNIKVSLQILSQYNLLSRRISTNARFRYNFREGHDLWIVLSETMNTERDRVIPALPAYQNRVLLVKYTYTFY
ncbi:carbohydrate binding family 9 domain-containing protein [Rhodohalobacter mucosus]|uniref:DUF5916 domain-containing protein n=1 Tax=Rhodohalobacter mucosus TaxID=2079485 RepID=A0A316TW00_9BACT|nr:carbohydrate binding family 9 domain-containing protein [Rhodohalobacter mucosus]PWN07355.1 hypothetical protein DDZ15_03565 [Rhodohalobacter mucosus]